MKGMTLMEPESKLPSGKMQMELRCRIDAAMLKLLREVVTSVASHLGFSEEETDEIELSVDEACANALEHAYDPEVSKEAPDKSVTLEIHFDGQALTVRVMDSGQGITRAMEIPIEDLEEYAAPGRTEYRGLGFHLMHKFMDHVQVRSEPGQGTTVEMIKIRK